MSIYISAIVMIDHGVVVLGLALVLVLVRRTGAAGVVRIMVVGVGADVAGMAVADTVVS